MRTHTRKLKRGGRRNGTNTATGSASAATSTNSSAVSQPSALAYNENRLRFDEPIDKANVKQVDYKFFAYLPMNLITKYKNQTKRNNLMKERYLTWITFNKDTNKETITLTEHINEQLAKQNKPLITGKVYEVAFINNVNEPLRNNPVKGTYVTNNNIGNSEDKLFPSNVKLGDSPLLKKHGTRDYYLKRGVGLKSLSMAMEDLKTKRGVKYVTLVPMNRKLEEIYASLGFIPVDNVKHTAGRSKRGTNNSNFIQEVHNYYKNIYYGGPGSGDKAENPTGRAMYKKL